MFSWLFSRLLGCWKELLLSALLIALALGAPSQDNLAALPDLVARNPPEQVLCAGPKAGSQSARRLQQELARLGTAVVDLESGQTLDLGEGAVLRVLADGRAARRCSWIGSGFVCCCRWAWISRGRQYCWKILN